MISTEDLKKGVNEYIGICRTKGIAPSYLGIGKHIGVSSRTISHIVTGYYKEGKPYTETPHATRCIGNDDFELIKGVFAKPWELVSLHEKRA